jgi:hypothetical protein
MAGVAVVAPRAQGLRLLMLLQEEEVAAQEECLPTWLAPRQLLLRWVLLLYRHVHCCYCCCPAARPSGPPAD